MEPYRISWTNGNVIYDDNDNCSTASSWLWIDNSSVVVVVVLAAGSDVFMLLGSGQLLSVLLHLCMAVESGYCVQKWMNDDIVVQIGRIIH